MLTDQHKESIVRLSNALLATCAVAGLALTGTAEAAHWRVGVFMGAPVAPYYYPVAPAPYYYAPYPAYPAYPAPVIVDPGQPDVYIEKGQDEAGQNANGAASAGTWYYCDASKKYYPYVKQCAGGWREVPATPPAPGR
jgi:hypothetical protein